MSSSEVLFLCSHVIQWSLMALVIAVPLRHLFITGQFLSAVRRMWLAYIIWSVVLCLAVPELLASISRNGEALEYFPEAKGTVAAAVAGWLPAIVICSVAYALRTLWLKFRSHDSSNQEA